MILKPLTNTHIGQGTVDAPIEFAEGVEEVLLTHERALPLVVATKGDLLDQERKLKNSALITISTT
jgi:putative hydrolase of the HAD superfamily